MESMSVSEFRAKCLAALRRVKRTGWPVLLTRFGEPVAEVGPPSRPTAGGKWLGAMKARAEIVGDVAGPALEPRSWKALRK